MLIMTPAPSAYIARVKRASKRFTSAFVAKRAKAHSALAIRSSVVAIYLSLSGVVGGGITAFMQALRIPFCNRRRGRSFQRRNRWRAYMSRAEVALLAMAVSSLSSCDSLSHAHDVGAR